jgi:prolyl-tRNA synthetase
MTTAITPTRAENFPEWYQQVIKKADLAETSTVHGCMIIKPWGYAIWENIQQELDRRIKETGHENLYFPLLIPLSYIEKEAEHVLGFAKECAVVTHHRLIQNREGKLVPASPLKEPLVIRPTSEAIVGTAFANWIQSYRDLPLLTNQWANIVRWEMRPRLFLRTTEFLWQEGHTAHISEKEARNEALKMLDVYADFAENFLAIPVIKGTKTENEKFPGAVDTYSIEAMMQDGKALQAGTSHFLGQKFARAFQIKYINLKGKQEYVWTTSWGVTTRLIGGVVMVHGDDDGLVLPPSLAPVQVVIIPVIHKFKNPQVIYNYCEKLAELIKRENYNNKPIRVKIDFTDNNPGNKAWYWVKKGVPIRLEIGPKEYKTKTVYLSRRDKKEKVSMPRKEFIDNSSAQLAEIQSNLLKTAKKFVKQNSVEITNRKDFYDYFTAKKPGFVYAYWREDDALERQIKQDLNVTVRCLPFGKGKSVGKCIFSGDKSGRLAVFAKAY